MTDAGVVGIEPQDVRLLSFWTTFASVIALAVFWRLVHSCFAFGVLAYQPYLGRLKLSEGRSPHSLAGHLGTVTNAVVCVAAAIPVARARLASNEWCLGALFPLWSRPLTITPPFPGSGTYYLSLAAYCFQSSLLALEVAVHGATGARTVLFQRFVLFLVVSSLCMVSFVPELTLALLVVEVTSPFVALWQALVDFRAHSDPIFGIAGCAALAAMLKIRVLLFGFSLACVLTHPESTKLSGARSLMIALCAALFVAYIAHFARLCREVHHFVRSKQDEVAPRLQRRLDAQ